MTDFYEIRSIALVLNLTVVSIGTYMYVKNRVFNLRQFWPFIAFSMPMAFLGAQLKLDERIFFLILGVSLLLASVFMALQAFKRKTNGKSFSLGKSGSLGGAVGFLSGVAGIGGGIFLSPILNLSGWANARSVAALASIFILCNSMAGIGGLLMADSFSLKLSTVLILVISVIIGGFLGSYISNYKLNMHIIRGLTAVLIAYVGLRLILLHGFEISI
ncbi:MAG: sulfite exporter TauE/SafE family protein [Cyclobacteriaceae bacterium]